MAASHGWLDHPEFMARHVAGVGDGRVRAELRIDGLKCGACLWLLEALPRLAAGVVSSRVDIGRSAIVLEWNPEATSLGNICVQAVASGMMPTIVAARARFAMPEEGPR